MNYTTRVALDKDDIDLRFLVHYVGLYLVSLKIDGQS